MLLVVNAGSSSLKLAVFDAGLAQVAQARAEVARCACGGAPGAAGEAAAVVAAEAAWLPLRKR